MYEDFDQTFENLMQELVYFGTADWAAMTKSAPKKQPTKSKKTCNVCGKACTKHCSLCHSVYYCSADCQRKDWKTHKKECSKIKTQKKTQSKATGTKSQSLCDETSKKNVPSSQASGKKPTPSNTRCEIESLPDKLLARIGTTVGELCGVRDYVSLMKTSKRFHRLLMDGEVQSNLIEKENRRIFGQVFHPDDLTMDMIIKGNAANLVELQLCQTLARLKANGLTNNNIFFEAGPRDYNDPNYAHFTLSSIGDVLLSNPCVTLILDCHSNSNNGFDVSEHMSKMTGVGVFRKLEQVMKQMTKKDVSWLNKRVHMRAWASTVVDVCGDDPGTCGRSVRDNLSWVQFSFRIGDMDGFTLPLHPGYYPSIFPPESVLFDDPYYRRFMDDGWHSESMESRLIDIVKFNGQGADEITVKLTVESFLVQARVDPWLIDYDPKFVHFLQDVLQERREAMAPATFVREAAADDYRGLLMEIIKKAGASGLKEASDPDLFFAVMDCRYCTHEKLGCGPFMDQLMLKMIIEESGLPNED